jgi:TROVE domain-containing protein
MRLNIFKPTPRPRTHEGARARVITPEQALRRSVLSCMLWEGEFYEDGVQIAGRIHELVPQVEAEKVAALAVEARERMKLRHAPLLLVREMARYATHRGLVAETLTRVIQRADELSEFVAIYWAMGRQPLSAQVKKGLAVAFGKFDEYALAKYDRAGAVRLRDVLFLCHARPVDEAQAALWKRLVDNQLATPDTWEVSLSAAGRDSQGQPVEKREGWERLLSQHKLGAMALLRNLRNMQKADVDLELIRKALDTMKAERVLPFRFVSAAKHAPRLEPELEGAMFKCLEGHERLAGKTILIVDCSGSMHGQISSKSELDRLSAAAALAMLLREICDEVAVYATAGNDSTRIHATMLVPSRRGFALRDLLAYEKTSRVIGGGGIFLKQVIDYVRKEEGEKADRIIVITDEQDCDLVNKPTSAHPFGRTNYLINVASFKNGIGYGEWTHIDGWSEAAITYIATLEAGTNAPQQ